MYGTPRCDLGAVEKGADFILHFSDRDWTLNDVAARYNCSAANARKLKEKIERLCDVEFVGYERHPHDRGCGIRNVWRLKKR